MGWSRRFEKFATIERMTFMSYVFAPKKTKKTKKTKKNKQTNKQTYCWIKIFPESNSKQHSYILARYLRLDKRLNDNNTDKKTHLQK